MLGNPTTTPHDDYNYRIPFAYMKALISQKQYEVFLLAYIYSTMKFN